MPKLISLLGKPLVISMALVDRDPGQPRQTFNPGEIEKLAANIRQSGVVLHPIFIRKHPVIDGRYMLVAGERRFLALESLGVEEFEFRVVEEELPHYIVSMIENSNRVDLNPIEVARSYEECMRRENLDIDGVAAYVGKSGSEVRRLLRYLKLDPEIQRLIMDGKLNQKGVANLAQFKGNLRKQVLLAQQLAAGEDPPEIEEMGTGFSERSASVIMANLPKDARGVLQRVLKMARSMKSLPILAETFEGFTREEKIEAICFFTGQTRRNVVEFLEENARASLLLVDQINHLPKSRKPVAKGRVVAAQPFPEPAPKPAPPSRPAAPSAPATVPARHHLPAEPRDVSEILGFTQRPALPVPVQRFRTAPDPDPARRRISEPVRPAATTNGNAHRSPLVFKEPPAPWESLTIHPGQFQRYAFYLRVLLHPQRDNQINLSVARFHQITACGDDPEAKALNALRAARSAWNLKVSDFTSKRREFVASVVQIRDAFGNHSFEETMNQVWSEDRAADPINLQLI